MKRALVFGAMAAILMSALIGNLVVLDLIAFENFGETLGRTLVVIGISTTAILLLILAGKLAGLQRGPEENPKG
jgi:hypothetical protein